MATTATKKEIVDYLWEWGEQNGEWAKLLVKEIIEKERALIEDERQEVYDLLLNAIGLKDNAKHEKLTRPKYTVAESDTKLKTLSNVQGVNRLAGGQTLEFSHNLTLIYGETGTGKTGYGRILMALGFSYEKGTKVLSNVYDNKDVKQSATITYVMNGDDREFVWDGTNHVDAKDLQGISIFNNSCVKLSLSTDRALLVTPIGFHLFSLLSNELRQLERIHEEYIETFDTSVPWLDRLYEGTKVYKFLDSLSQRSTLDELNKLGTFTEKDEVKLKKAEGDLKNLNKELLDTQIKELKVQLTELRGIIKKVQTTQSVYTKELWQAYQKNLKKFRELEQNKKTGLNEIAERRGIELYESNEFQEFIKAADEYLQKMGKDDYPADDNEICIYCRQKLRDADARELLKSYRELLHDTIEADIKELKANLDITRTSIEGIDSDLIFHHPVFGQNDEEKPLQPAVLTSYNEKISTFIELIQKSEKDRVQEQSYDMNFTAILKEMGEKERTIKEAIQTKEETLITIAEKEEKLTKQINEFKDAKLLSSSLKGVTKVIENKILVNKLNNKSSCFSTNSVSRKTTEARAALIADNFNEEFKSELKKIRRSEIKINLDFHTERGQSKLVQYIQSQYELPEILSEGEQKAIALAEFLAELKLDKSNAPVIFDDPVTSLDHHIIDEVARRLVNLSKDRQVVIFTHSILLFNSIKQKSELPSMKKVNYKYYETEKDTEFTGYLYDSPDLKQDSFTNYEKNINKILNLPKEERTRRESELAVEGYNKLRAAIEVLVEQEILHGVVKRYRKNVALTSLEKIKGNLIQKHKEDLNAIFERCCGYVDAHSDPDPLVQNPDLEGLKLDFKAVQDIRKEFLN